MNLILFFVGGLSLITGWYGLIEQGYSPIYTIAVVWGAFCIGIQVGEHI